jgi:hypothetical protein
VSQECDDWCSWAEAVAPPVFTFLIPRMVVDESRYSETV